MTKKLIFPFVFLVMASCSNSDDSNGEIPTSENTLTATVNGRSFASDEAFTEGNLFVNDFATIFTISATLVESDLGVAQVESISLAISFQNEEDFSTGRSFSSSSEDESIISVVGQYIIGESTLSDANATIASSAIENGEAFFRITALDTSSRTISGEFSFLALDESNGDEYRIANGRFNNVYYEIN